MSWVDQLKNGLLVLLGLLLTLLGVNTLGKRQGRAEAREEAEQAAERDRLAREAAGNQAVADAADERREVELEHQKGGADEARQNMRDRWTRQ